MRNLSVFVVLLTWCGPVVPAGGQPLDTLRVMTFNVWSGEDTEAGRNKLVEIISASDADVVGIQEMQNSAGLEIAADLGFEYHQQSGGDIQVLSRFPIVRQSAGNRGVEVAVSATQSVWIFNAHLAAYPYQPYDLRDGTLLQVEADVVAAANAARGSQVSSYLNEMADVLSRDTPVFFTGDFNEPSHLDWTAAAAAETVRPFDLKVEYPASKRVVDAGLTDSFRALRPDEVNDRAYTWTPGYPPPTLSHDEVHDRIDFVYHRGSGVVPTLAFTLGLDATNPNTDIGIDGYNADHRAVVVEFSIPECRPTLGDFDGNCIIDEADWQIIRDYQHVDLMDLSPAEAATKGDMNGDLMNDHADFVLFKQRFEWANGPGSFAFMIASVPEPSTSSLLGIAGVALLAAGSRACFDVSRYGE